jgi:hypothetical protein
VQILETCGSVAQTALVVAAVAGLFLSTRADLRPSRYPRADRLRGIGPHTRTGTFGALAGAAGAGLATLVTPVHGTAGLGVALGVGTLADACRYLVEYRKGAGTYRGTVREAATLVACVLAGLEAASSIG